MPRKPTKEKTPAVEATEVLSVNPMKPIKRTNDMNSNSQTQNTLSLVIGDLTILQDEEGRYSLNDLHNAAGGAAKHAPSRWMRYQQAMDLIAELESALTNQKEGLTSLIRPVKTTEGRYGGTFVVKELIYAYAMWISPAFSLKVIRAYDSMFTSNKGHNLSIGISMTNWLRSVSMGSSLMKSLALCTDLGVAAGQYSTLLQVNRVCGIATPPLERLAPGLRQQLLALEVYDKSEGGAA